MARVARASTADVDAAYAAAAAAAPQWRATPRPRRGEILFAAAELLIAGSEQIGDFWVDVLGAELYREYGGSSVVLRFAGTWLLLVTGGGPTADKPGVVFVPPGDPDRVSHAVTLRVADCRAAYAALAERGASFLAPPHDWGGQIRCFLRGPDGHLVEISQSVPA